MSPVEQIKNFIKDFDHCVLSTVNEDGTPESAIIEFAETSDLELIFDTSNQYRKYRNLIERPRVAVAIGSREAKAGLQYEGIVELVRQSELDACKEILFEKCPGARKFENNPDCVYFRVRPGWIRYRSYQTDPPTVLEHTF